MSDIHINAKVIHIHTPVIRATTTPYLEFVKAISPCPERELEISIDCANPYLSESSPWPSADYLDREIRLWSSVVGPRSHCSLCLFNPYGLLEPFELTKLVHTLASGFEVANVPREHMIVSGIDDIQAEGLALLKGLAFNRYCLVVDLRRLSSIDVLGKSIALIREFGIDHIDVQLVGVECFDNICEGLKVIKESYKPNHIFLGSKATDLNNIDGQDLDTGLGSCGDRIELGPGGCAQLGAIRVQNYYSVDKYMAHIDIGRLALRDL